jgi:hypothetical protein
MTDPRWKVAPCEDCRHEGRAAFWGRYEGGHMPHIHADTISEVIDQIHALTTEVPS